MSSSTQVVFRTAVLLRGLNQPGATGNNQMINQPNIQVQGLHFNKSFNYNCDITKSQTVPQKLNIKITFFIQTGFKNLSTDTKPGPKRFKGLSLWIWCQWVFNVWKQLRGSVLCSHSVSKIYYSIIQLQLLFRSTVISSLWPIKSAHALFTGCWITTHAFILKDQTGPSVRGYRHQSISYWRSVFHSVSTPCPPSPRVLCYLFTGRRHLPCCLATVVRQLPENDSALN